MEGSAEIARPLATGSSGGSHGSPRGSHGSPGPRGSPGSGGSRTTTPTAVGVRPRPRIPTTLTNPVLKLDPDTEITRRGSTGRLPVCVPTRDSFRKIQLPVAGSASPEEKGLPIYFTVSAGFNSCSSVKNSAQEPQRFVVSGDRRTNSSDETEAKKPTSGDDVINRTSIRRTHSHRDGGDVTQDGGGLRHHPFVGLIQGQPEATSSVGRAMSLVNRKRAVFPGLLRPPPTDFLSEVESRMCDDDDDLEGQRSRPSSENSVLRSESKTGARTVDQRSRLDGDEGQPSGTRSERLDPLLPDKSRATESGGEGRGSAVFRSLSLRKLRTLDRFATPEIRNQAAHPNGGGHVTRAEVTSSKMADDEGVASLEGNNSENSLPAIFSALPGDDDDVVVDRPEPDVTSRRSARGIDQNSPTTTTTTTTAVARFLTHPPGGGSRERSVTVGSGPVDSNGFGALRAGGGGFQTPEEDPTKTSYSSIDSHICLSDDGLSSSAQGDPGVENDDQGGPGKMMDRRNSKNQKQKSKSDPIGEKSGGDGAGLPTVLGAIVGYTQSSPVIIENNRRKFSFGDDDDGKEVVLEKRWGGVGEEGASRPQSLQLSSLASSGSVESPTPEDSEVSAVLRHQDSFEDHVLITTAFKPPRPLAAKRRPKPVPVTSPEPPEPPEQPEPARRRHDRGGGSARLTTGESANRSVKPASGLTSSQTVPHHLSKKTVQVLRNQRSVESDPQPEVILTSPEMLSPGEEEPPLGGIRGRHLSGNPEFLLNATSGGGIRSVTSSIGGSVQELYRSASPRFKSRPGAGAVGVVGPSPAPSTPASFSPSLDTILSQSTLNLFESTSEDKDKRDFILHEFYSTEKQYVEALQMLVEKYMIPMKTQCVLDSNLVDEIFYKINEIYMHHATFLTFLDRSLKNWTPQSTVGDIILKNFSKQSVIECYISFIQHFPRAEKVLDEVAAKSSFQKLIEQSEKETRTKLPLKAQIVKPAQRVPRYELLLKRLLDNTPTHHPDYPLLQQAERAIHELAIRINSVKESKHGEDLQETLKKLELLLITDIASPDRLYLRHDMVTIPSRKDQCCLWLFSDLLVISTVKRKSTAVNRRTSLLLQSPTGNDFVENSKHKLWLKVPLDSVELIQGPEVIEIGRQIAERMDLQSDYEMLAKMAELTAKLKCSHQVVDDAVREVFNQVNRQLTEHQLRTPPPEEHSVDIVANTQDGPISLSIVFQSADKKASWESAVLSYKQKTVQVTDKKLPEFLQPLPITKTRAGMQFSCAVATEPSSTRLDREVLVCNSDGYVGHVCLLNLLPEPIVTLNTPVPGCNSRIVCICAVPPFHLERKRKRGDRRSGDDVPQPLSSAQREGQQQETRTESDSTTNSESEYESVDGRGNEERLGTRCSQENEKTPSSTASPSPSSSLLFSSSASTANNNNNNKNNTVPGSGPTTTTTTTTTTTQSPVIDPTKSTVWLGTEDGCIQIFATTENIRTTKNKLKMQQNASILAIVYLNSRVFVSVANGDIVVYRRNRTDGTWDCHHPDVINLSSSSAPISRMIAVFDHLWCACLNDVIVLATPFLDVEVQSRFVFNQDQKQGVINAMASEGHAVWISGKNSSKVVLYHATTCEALLEINVASTVSQKLQSSDDIIRQHKMACLRITALLCCKSMLWIGTSAGIILTLTIPSINKASTKRCVCNPPQITGLPHGHTGHVRFLTSVEVPSQPASVGSTSVSGGTSDPGSGRGVPASDDRSSPGFNRSSPKSVNTIVISGGDGYEDFLRAGMGAGAGAGATGGASVGGGETAGRDDSTNHLLLWRI